MHRRDLAVNNMAFTHLLNGGGQVVRGLHCGWHPGNVHFQDPCFEVGAMKQVSIGAI